jgi:hypothetical protein
MDRVQRHEAFRAAAEDFLLEWIMAIVSRVRKAPHREGGVFAVTLDIDDMRAIDDAEPEARPALFDALDVTWLTEDEFVDFVREHHEDTDAARRWALALKDWHGAPPPRANPVVPPTALLLRNNPDRDPEGLTFMHASAIGIRKDKGQSARDGR